MYGGTLQGEALHVSVCGGGGGSLFHGLIIGTEKVVYFDKNVILQKY
jgi:hypothetical protein